MVYEDNINNLKNSMNIKSIGTGKHTINIRAPFLPFKTRNPERPKFKKDFMGVIGELIRLINLKKLNNNFDINLLLENISNNVTYSKEEDREYLLEILRGYLLNKDGDITIFHSDILNYLPFTECGEGKGEEEIAKFLYDIYFIDNKDIKKLLSEKEKTNVITKLIISGLDKLEDNNEKRKYFNNLQYVSEVAKEDFAYITKNKEYFLRNLELLVAYYYFFYIIQLTITLNKKTKGNYNKINETYYLLDWEMPGKNRPSSTNGYKFVKSEMEDLLVNINLIEHLNFIFDVKGYNFEKINDLYNTASEEKKRNYLETLREWIIFYKNNFRLEPLEEINLEYNELLDLLESSLKQKIEQATISRYRLSIEEIGKKFFLKRRGGAYGYMLNVNQELLLLITAISVKKDKITIKELFYEYERRGLYFDNNSKYKIIELLGKLNLIDKKSDSGDAQYVKSIL